MEGKEGLEPVNTVSKPKVRRFDPSTVYIIGPHCSLISTCIMFI